MNKDENNNQLIFVTNIGDQADQIDIECTSIF